MIEPQNAPGSALDGWQSANCTEEIEESGEFCSPSTPNLYFKKAGGHPKFGFTQYIIQNEVEGSREPIREPKIDRTIKNLHVELPAGLTVKPLATER